MLETCQICTDETVGMSWRVERNNLTRVCVRSSALDGDIWCRLTDRRRDMFCVEPWKEGFFEVPSTRYQLSKKYVLPWFPNLLQTKIFGNKRDFLLLAGNVNKYE